MFIVQATGLNRIELFFDKESRSQAKFAAVKNSNLFCSFVDGKEKKFYNVDVRTTPIGQNFSVPDSCCHVQSAGCGYRIFKESEDQVPILNNFLNL